MKWLNYHHLYYFYMVAKEGTISRAAEKLRVSQPSISGQIKLLEESLEQQLFVKKGRNLVLSEFGESILPDAEKIFETGNTLIAKAKSDDHDKMSNLSIGVVDSIPKIMIANLVSRFLGDSPRHRAYCREGFIDFLMMALLEGKLDLILTDNLPPTHINVNYHAHVLGHTKLLLYGTSKLKNALKKGKVPLLLPIAQSGIREIVARWVKKKDIDCEIIAEVEDSALLNLLASKGHGLVCETQAVEDDIWKKYHLKRLGVLDEQLTYYAITMDKKIRYDHVSKFVEFIKEVLKLDLLRNSR